MWRLSSFIPQDPHRACTPSIPPDRSCSDIPLGAPVTFRPTAVRACGVVGLAVKRAGRRRWSLTLSHFCFIKTFLFKIFIHKAVETQFKMKLLCFLLNKICMAGVGLNGATAQGNTAALYLFIESPPWSNEAIASRWDIQQRPATTFSLVFCSSTPVC